MAKIKVVQPYETMGWIDFWWDCPECDLSHQSTISGSDLEDGELVLTCGRSHKVSITMTTRLVEDEDEHRQKSP